MLINISYIGLRRRSLRLTKYFGWQAIIDTPTSDYGLMGEGSPFPRDEFNPETPKWVRVLNLISKSTVYAPSEVDIVPRA